MSAEISMIADAEVSLENDATAKVLQLVAKLEDNEDVPNVYTNISIPEGFEAE
jgi:transcriptional/translational regulatory protein YebC/TACO1